MVYAQLAMVVLRGGAARADPWSVVLFQESPAARLWAGSSRYPAQGVAARLHDRVQDPVVPAGYGGDGGDDVCDRRDFVLYAGIPGICARVHHADAVQLYLRHDPSRGRRNGD